MKENSEGVRKIIFLITGSNVGGAETIVKNIIFNIDRKKFTPIFVSIRPLGVIGQEISKKCEVFSAEAKSKFNLLFLFKLYYFIKNKEPDILHCHLFHANFLGRIIGGILGIPFIISTVHSDNIGRRYRYFLLKITDFLNDMTIVVSEKIKRDLIKNHITTDKKIQVIYNGIEDNNNLITTNDINKLKQNLKIETSCPIILSVGRLNIIKGHIYLIKAVKLLIDKFSDLKLILVGDGPEKVNIEKEVLNLNLGNNVLFLGEVRNIDIYYKLADVFVSPSINEGFGLTIIEAMKNKVITVASYTGGVPEIIKDGVNGFMVNPKNEVDLSNMINKIYLLSKSEKEKIIDNAYNNFKSNFSLDKMINQYNKLYL